MSTYYRPTMPIELTHIKENLNLKKIGFKVVDNDEEDEHYFIYKDNYIHYATNHKGEIIDTFRYGRNNADLVLSVLEEEYEMNWISEYEGEYAELTDEDTSVIHIKISDLIGEQT
jgi:hypothetical protein